MALVPYSDSDSGSEASEISPPPPLRGTKRKARQSPAAAAPAAPNLPPLPSAFHNLYASSTRVSVRDDPSLHGGRKRVIPHIEGNWPSHVYLECKPTEGQKKKIQANIGKGILQGMN